MMKCDVCERCELQNVPTEGSGVLGFSVQGLLLRSGALVCADCLELLGLTHDGNLLDDAQRTKVFIEALQSLCMSRRLGKGMGYADFLETMLPLKGLND